jgi:glucose/arabinose dehydrogenase
MRRATLRHDSAHERGRHGSGGVRTRHPLDFGFPYCHGIDIVDPELGQLGQCAKSTPPVQALGANVAPLGLRFYTGESFPPAYRDQIFIAEHGSWNRSVPAGYRISRVRLDGDTAVAYEPFVTGFRRDDEVFGRPVDVAVAADGALLISDDHAGAVYRVRYAAPR